jgi:NAD(P)-dependent dehydrogenase (short-subunit alcohol dehydrogenase family)
VERLDGKVAIVTGASRGLGKDIATALARQGAAVAVAARTDAEGESRIPGSLQHTVQLIRDAGGTAETVRCDVANEDDIANAVKVTLERFGRIDILVNNAGILVPGAVMDIQSKHWKLIFRVNVDGPFFFCRAVIPHLREAGGGHIINISSRGAIGPGPGPYERPPATGGAAYGATKAAVERFSQGLAAEVFQDRISVNALSPHLPIWSEGGAYFRQRSGTENYSGWRMSGDVIGDAAVVICNQEPGRYTGNILYDELVMRNEGGLGDAVMTRYPVEP